MVQKVDHEEKFNSILWGPTCDCLDQLEPNVQLPRLAVGDWLLFPVSGAYTTAIATDFNGFPRPTFFYMISEDSW